jgi:hypothetical protein
MDEARARLQRDEERAADVRRRGGEGLTMFGVHVTAGVVGGSLMLISGVMCMMILAFCWSVGIVVFNPRILAGAFVGTVLGAVTLVRALVFGQEE